MASSRRPVAVLIAVLGLMLSTLGFGAASASAYPAGTGATLSLNVTTMTQGGSITAFGAHFNGTVTLTGHPGAVPLGTATADASGSFTTTFTVAAASFSVGAHSVTATDAAGDSATANFTVTAAGTTPGGGGGGGLATTGVAVIGIGALGVLLLIGGGMMLLAGRRRKATV